MRIAFLMAPEGVEQIELTDPWEAVAEAGGAPVLVSTKSGRIQAFNHLDKADTFPVDQVVDDVSADSFDGLVVPGGVANPDALRLDQRALSFVRDFFDQGRPVAAIAMPPGRSSKRASSRAACSLRGRACRRTSATRAAPGSTSRCTSATKARTSWSPAVNRMT